MFSEITSSFMVPTISVIPKGITLQLTKLKTSINNGANTKIRAFDLEGTINSFTTSLRPSAIGCNSPQKPTTFGPRLRCIDAITLRSASVK
jgi:hypothetical protein